MTPEAATSTKKSMARGHLLLVPPGTAPGMMTKETKRARAAWNMAKKWNPAEAEMTVVSMGLQRGPHKVMISMLSKKRR